jgi:glycosyltransferase involved in cell wall biosynthesis
MSEPGSVAGVDAMPGAGPPAAGGETAAARKRQRIGFFLATSGHSGVDRIMRNLIPAIAARGYAVDLLHVRGHGPVLDETPDNVRVVDLGSGHVYTCLPALIRYLRRERPAALLSDKDRVNRTALVGCALSRMPVRLVLRTGTTVSHNLAGRGAIERRLQRFSMRHLYRYGYATVVPSCGAADDLARYAGIDRRHIQVLPSPVVTDRLYSDALTGVEHPWLQARHCPVILGVGELSRRKDFATLIRAFAELRRRRAARLIILGRGRQADALRRLTRDCGVAADVDLPGFDPNPYRFLARADLFVLASRWEGMPVALIEAVALGTPVVATDCPSGPREILRGGRYGPLVPVGDAAALASAMGEVLDHPLPKEQLQEAVVAYHVDRSAGAYLAAMGFPGR